MHVHLPLSELQNIAEAVEDGQQLALAKRQAVTTLLTCYPWCRSCGPDSSGN